MTKFSIIRGASTPSRIVENCQMTPYSNFINEWKLLHACVIVLLSRAVQALLDAIIQFFRRDVFRTAACRALPVSGFSERFTLVWHFQQLIVLIKINFISLRSFHRFQFFFCERNVLVDRYNDDEWRSDGAACRD